MNMLRKNFKILSKENLTHDIVQMDLLCSDSDCPSVVPGQFIDIALDGFYLRRPISICDAEGDRLRIVFKVVGNGTAFLMERPCGSYINVLFPLGNGFDISVNGGCPVLIGGGVGVPPLFLLARRMLENTDKVNVVLGFNSKEDIILAEDFRRIGCEVTIATVDGSEGVKGFVTDALRSLKANDTFSYFYACGPRPMLQALSRELRIPGEVSMEERMGCGFGACMGCTCHTSEGPRLVCKDGPVFKKEVIFFE